MSRCTASVFFVTLDVGLPLFAYAMCIAGCESFDSLDDDTLGDRPILWYESSWKSDPPLGACCGDLDGGMPSLLAARSRPGSLEDIQYQLFFEALVSRGFIVKQRSARPGQS